MSHSTDFIIAPTPHDPHRAPLRVFDERDRPSVQSDISERHFVRQVEASEQDGLRALVWLSIPFCFEVIAGDPLSFPGRIWFFSLLRSEYRTSESCVPSAHARGIEPVSESDPSSVEAQLLAIVCPNEAECPT